ncbi:hypothetical protein SO802_011546 [Lithocarpus litseifolius]|uniref:Reverse transcriptase zinc-binding domain-containing protein n=1 Tax=Lithocarpus litseifolius TaxID=425828 RepID=A0AAW2D4E9_9ROSI
MKRKILADPSCHRCGRQPEDIMRALWGCEAVKQVWVPEIFATTAWFIWTHRNKTRLNEQTLPSSEISAAAKKFLLAFTASQAIPQGSKNARKQTWVPPKPGEFKTNFDGAMFNENDEAGIRIVVRNSLGQSHFEGDSEIGIKALRKGHMLLSSFGHLVQDTLLFASSLRSLSFSHTVRQGWLYPSSDDLEPMTQSCRGLVEIDFPGNEDSLKETKFRDLVWRGKESVVDDEKKAEE